VKSLLSKGKQDHRDPYLGLLEHRNTPIDGVGSPAQLLMSRRLRSIIPTTKAQLQQKVLDSERVREKLKLKQDKQKHYFDQYAKHLPALEIGDRVRVQMGGRWKPGVVTGREETPRPYRIQTDEGAESLRNRRMLAKSPESAPLSPCTSPCHESPSMRAIESAPLRDQADQTTPSAKEPTSMKQNIRIPQDSKWKSCEETTTFQRLCVMMKSTYYTC